LFTSVKWLWFNLTTFITIFWIILHFLISLIDLLVFNTNFSSISAISWHTFLISFQVKNDIKVTYKKNEELSNKRKRRRVIEVGMKHFPQFMVYSLSFIVIRYLNDHVMWCFNITASLSHLLQQLNDGNNCNKFFSGFWLF
jgi:hypothetical protein